MAEITKLDTDMASLNFSEMGAQKISVTSLPLPPNGFHYKSEKNENVVVDIEGVPPFSDKDAAPNSRIMLQRNLSRKGIQRGGEKKTNSSPSANDKDNKNVTSPLCLTTSSPRALKLGSGSSDMASPVGTPDHQGNPPVQHQITITSSNMNAATAIPENKWTRRSYSFRRSSSSWAINPRKILLFFATLSSMGTMLLLYFTLSVSKFHMDSDSVDWQQ